MGKDSSSTTPTSTLIIDTFTAPPELLEASAADVPEGGFFASAAPPTPPPRPPASPSQWAVTAFSALNVVTGCAALAVAKQIVNPANFQPPPADLADLPKWYKDGAGARYPQAYLAQAAMKRVVFDTGVLLVASGTWYGVQHGLRAARGVEDAANVAVAGGLSASLLGATFFETLSLRRVGIWGAVGAAMGYYSFQQRQLLKEHLLQRQQELEQKHLHVPPDQVQQRLQPDLLRQLLRMEEELRGKEVRTHLESQGINTGRPPHPMADLGHQQRQQQQQQQWGSSSDGSTLQDGMSGSDGEGDGTGPASDDGSYYR